MAVNVAVVRETLSNERRVALTPEVAKKLKSKGASVLIQHGAGDPASFPDASYKEVEVGDAAASVLGRADVLLKVQPPSLEEIAQLREGSVVISLLQPHLAPERTRALRDRKITAFAMELLPRTTRAQAMDVLSSQAGVAGYKAVLIAAEASPKFFPMLTTAAGTIRPSKVLIVGAGVAGLQAIATAKRLGAIVEAYDVRSATRDQIKSLGAKFVETGVSAEGAGGYARELTEEEKAKQQEVLEKHIAAADAVISTAAVPGRAAPRIIRKEAVARMKAGAVVVDIAAETGGNCELTRAGETVVVNGVRIIGPVNLPAQLPYHASEMYARNVYNLMKPALSANGDLTIDWNDEVFAQSALTHDGQIRHEPTAKLL
jgi:NAD(P) transhydrogenase subunit alpha